MTLHCNDVYDIILRDIAEMTQNRFNDMPISIFTNHAGAGCGLSGDIRNSIRQNTIKAWQYRRHEVYIHSYRHTLTNHCRLSSFRAKSEAKKVIKGPAPWAGTSKEEIHLALYDQMVHLWNKEWFLYNEAHQTKQWIKGFKPSDLLTTFDHKEIIRVIQLITGHGPFLYHKIKTDIDVTDTTCRLCNGGEETPLHLIRECSETIDTRDLFDAYDFNLTHTQDTTYTTVCKTGKDPWETLTYKIHHIDLEHILEGVRGFANQSSLQLVFELLGQMGQ